MSGSPGRKLLPSSAGYFTGRYGRELTHPKAFRQYVGHIVRPETGEAVDEALVSVMRAPRSYTREEMAEISAHGGPAPLRAILELCLAQGARLAEPGEFTRRAFLNGRIDLTQAEAVLDTIRARTDAGLRAAQVLLRGDWARCSYPAGISLCLARLAGGGH